MKLGSTNQLAPSLQLVDPVHVRAGGRVWLYFGGCDYLRVSQEPSIRQAIQRGVARWGVSVSASRSTTGNREVYETLECALADFFKVESAVVVSSGYVSDLVAAQALAGRHTHAFVDERAHVALADAVRFLECPAIRFRHRDPEDLARRVDRLGVGARPILLTDGLFAHDGSVAPLRAYARVLPRSARMLVDDAHGAAVLGRHGRGAAELERAEGRRVVRTITLSKAFGVYGGAILGSAGLRTAILRKSRLFVGNTPLPPSLAQAALEAVRLVRRRPALRSRLDHNTRYLRRLIKEGGVSPTDHPGPVFGIYPRAARSREPIHRSLMSASILPPFIEYPGGPEGGYYRFALSSAHRRTDLDAVAESLLRCRDEWSVAPPNQA